MKKRLLALVLTLCMAACLATVAFADVDKSKTAKWVDDSKVGDTAEVTLSLPSESYKKAIDVVFVLDGSFSQDETGMPAKAASLLDELNGYENLTVKTGLVVFGGYTPILSAPDNLSKLDDTTLNSLKNALQNQETNEKTGWKDTVGRKGSNLHAGIVKAQDLLDADQDVAAADKYMVILSDGGAFSWYDATTGKAVSTYYLYEGTQDQSAANAEAYWCNPEDYRYVHGGETSYNFAALMGTDETTMQTKLASYTGSFKDTLVDSTQTSGTKAYHYNDYQSAVKASALKALISGDILYPRADSVKPTYVSSREAALYYAANAIKSASQNSNVIFVTNAYKTPTEAAGHSAEPELFAITECFKQWLSDSGLVTLYRVNGNDNETTYVGTNYADKVTDISKVFANIKDELVYLIGAGSTVKDVIGKDFDLAGVDTFKLTVDGEEITGKVADDGVTVNFGNQITLNDESTYQYVVTYNKEEDSFTWAINEPVSKAGGVQLTYQVKLVNVTAGEEVSADTNVSAEVIPVDTEGKTQDSETFDIPSVKYDCYKVTYTDGVNGEAFNSQTFIVIKGNDTPAFDGTPTRDGYTFTGWSPTVSATVTGDVTYTAQWTANATPAPTAAPTATPKPTAAPTAAPTATPTAAPTTTVPQTGDSFPLVALVALMAVAAAGFGYTLYRKNKNR